MKQIISIAEARKILGKESSQLADDEIVELINSLDLLAKDALLTAKRRLQMKQDATNLANVVYDVYKETKDSGMQ